MQTVQSGKTLSGRKLQAFYHLFIHQSIKALVLCNCINTWWQQSNCWSNVYTDMAHCHRICQRMPQHFTWPAHPKEQISCYANQSSPGHKHYTKHLCITCMKVKYFISNTKVCILKFELPEKKIESSYVSRLAARCYIFLWFTIAIFSNTCNHNSSSMFLQHVLCHDISNTRKANINIYNHSFFVTAKGSIIYFCEILNT